MSLLNVSAVSFRYSSTDFLFTGASFAVRPGDRIAIVGPNGCGKSTLLKLLLGELAPTEGQIIRRKGLTCMAAEQELPLEFAGSAFEFALAARPEIAGLHRRLRDLEARTFGPDFGPEYAALVCEYQQANGYAVEAEAERALMQLGFTNEECNLPLQDLSGGQRTRAALARALLAQVDLLFLDEPTSHLDVCAREWLERTLVTRRGACILTSHDRMLLRVFARRVVEIERGGIRVFEGGYEEYRRRRTIAERQAWVAYEAYERRKTLAEEAAKKRAQLASRVATAPPHTRHGKDFYGRKAAKVDRTARILRERAQHEPAVAKPWQDAPIPPLLFRTVPHGSDTVVAAANLSKSYGSKCLFKNLSFALLRRQRLAIAGPNGAGKTTLMRILAGDESPDSGTVTMGANTRVACFMQDPDDLDLDRSALEICGSGTEPRTLLACLKLEPNRVFQPLRQLSGGERNKVALARLLLSGANLLLLDEPTNYLDIEALEALENALAIYPGALVVISHDRAFLAALGAELSVLPLGAAMTGVKLRFVGESGFSQKPPGL